MSGEHLAHFVSCLSIDLIGSTKAGLELTTALLDRFNVSLVEQIKPHLQQLGLAECLVKFTGDGWLVITPDASKVPALCCLALIVGHGFQREMAQVTEIDPERIPAVRLAVCSGRDVLIELPDGRLDWVGDSARRAVRVSGYCFPNEILIDEPIRLHVFRDFVVKPADVNHRPPDYRPKRMEEIIPSYVLGLPKPAAAEGPGAPANFVYTMEAIRQAREAKTVARRAMERLAYDTSELGTAEKESLRRMLEGWNVMMAGQPTYERALEVLKVIEDSGLSPDVNTYKTLIGKSPDYDTARAWVRRMQMERVTPDLEIYNALIAKAPSYETARLWLETMRSVAIRPDLQTYNMLISKSPDYPTARGWMDEMQAAGVRPDVTTHRALLGKGVMVGH